MRQYFVKFWNEDRGWRVSHSVLASNMIEAHEIVGKDSPRPFVLEPVDNL